MAFIIRQGYEQPLGSRPALGNTLQSRLVNRAVDAREVRLAVASVHIGVAAAIQHGCISTSGGRASSQAASRRCEYNVIVPPCGHICRTGGGGIRRRHEHISIGCPQP